MNRKIRQMTLVFMSANFKKFGYMWTRRVQRAFPRSAWERGVWIPLYAVGMNASDCKQRLIELMAFLVPHMSNDAWQPEQVRAYLADMLPKLKHWAK